MQRPARSLRVQIVGTVGVVIIVLIGVVSLAVLHEARGDILSQQTRRAESAARAFGIAVVDAFIVGDRIRSVAGDLLENHIRRFSGEIDDLLYIRIVDNDGRIVAHTDPSLYDTRLTDSVALQAARVREPATAIFRDASGRWVTEATVPLGVGARRWGSASLGFDAEPTHTQISRLFVLLLTLTLTATGVTLGVLYFFIRRLTAALGALVVEVDRIDFESEEPIRVDVPNNEIGYLVRHFDLLKRRLAQSRTQLAAAQHQMYQAEKLASVGRLAAGVAHEVNNPLNGMRFCLHGIRQDGGDPARSARYVELIGDGITQIETVVRQLLGFARRQPASFDDINLNDQVARVLELLAFQLRDRAIDVQLALDDDVSPLRADASLIQEVLMNLLLNAIDAVPHGGIIRVRTDRAPDGGATLTVTDNGGGIAPEHLASIFEPFFTTKDPGRGTGLGLAVTQSIVERHGGTIRVHSVQGTRTTFTVTLPAAAGTANP